MKKIVLSENKKMPWKNGLGTTFEIICYPNDKYEWRLSRAIIEKENQFSHFPGFERILVIISGDGLRLNQFELQPFEPYSFSGNDSIHCVPRGKVVQDLGLIFNPQQWTARAVVSVQELKSLSFPEPPLILIYAISDQESFLNQNLLAGETIILEPGEMTPQQLTKEWERLEAKSHLLPAKLVVFLLSKKK